MLLELRIQDLLLIDRAEIRPGEGLNVITGETGAGKTMLAHALDLLLGGKPRSGIVRPGATEAYVEGVFKAPAGLLEAAGLGDLCERVGELADGELVLARRVGASGRTRAFVQGRSAVAADLRELGARLVAYFGQHEHRRLTLSSAQLDLLDGFCGPEHIQLRAELTEVHAHARASRARLEGLRGRAGARDRDLDLLAFELEEIEALDPSEGDEEALRRERERLRRIDALRAAAEAGAEAIAPAESALGVSGLLAEAERLGVAAEGADRDLDSLIERMRALRLEADDLGADLRRYAEGLEAEPGRLEQLEERLDAYDRLKRKHGGTVQDVLDHAARCRAERAELERADVATEEAEAELAEAEERRAALARALGASRRQALRPFEKAVTTELEALAMEGAEFSVELHEREEPGPSGNERVELMLAPNPGVPAAPLRESASGGELSRVMLALMSVAEAGGSQALVFDEVDAGVGGQTARAVADRLGALAGRRQVLCITHLPQIAAVADSHFRIEKSAPDGLATASVERLDGEHLVEELCRMLGADTSDAGARRHAEELLKAAA